MKERIVVLSFTNPVRDPRVHRQLQFLQEDYEVTCVGTGNCSPPNVQFIQLPSIHLSVSKKLNNACRLGLRRYEAFYWSQDIVRAAQDALADVDADVWLANDLETLPLVLQCANRRPVVLDAHEYSPRQFEDNLQFRLLFSQYNAHLCRRYIPRVAAMMTVSHGIAQKYKSDTGIQASVVWSAPSFVDLQPGGVAKDIIELVHHGSASRSRRLERMIELMGILDERFRLTLILVPGSEQYIQELKQLGSCNGRISFAHPVPIAEIPHFLNQFDIGLTYFEPTTFNLRHAMPNKFFEFIQARLAIALGPTQEMAAIVQQHQLGVVAEEFSVEALASVLNGLSREQISKYKKNVHAVAQDYSSDSVRDKFLSIVQSVLE